MKLLINIVFVFVFISTVSGQRKDIQIYIAENGNDASSGTRKKPIKTIAKAQELATRHKGKKSVEIIFEDGTYYLTEEVIFSSKHSGTKDHPIVYRAANEGKAVISGGALLTLDWELYQDGIYKAQVPAEINFIDQLYINGQNQRMARYPNVVDGKNVFDTWDLVHTKVPDPDNDPLAPERVASWSDPTGAYVHAMHQALWGGMSWVVKGRNDDGTLDLEGGWQNNRPSPMHPRYRMVENVFEELDVPNEWYYDKKAQTLYYYPEAGLDIKKAKVEVVRLQRLFVLEGTKDQPVEFLEFKGFVFRHAARSFMENKEQLLRSDWTVFRGGAIQFTGAENCSITNCEFDQLGGNSIFVNNYNRNITIKGCYIHHSGASGVAFVGDPNMVRSPLFRYGPQDYGALDLTPGPKGDNFPQDCRVEDCLITMTGRNEKQTAPVQISMASRITVSHCSIYDVPRAGINISEGTFGGHIIEYCDVFNTVLETGDHGSFNSWGRDRFWSPDFKEVTKQVAQNPDLPFLDILEPNIIRNSRWRCDHGWDIDLDDGSSRYRIYNNLLLNNGLKLREGFDRIVTNNIIINNSLHLHVWYTNSGDVIKKNIVSGAYKPIGMARSIGADGKWGAQLDSNLFISTEADRIKFLQNQVDVHSLVGDALFMDPKNGDFRVAPNSPAIQLGFKNFPMDQFGVVSEKLKRIAKQPEIPTLQVSSQNDEAKIYKWYDCTVKNIETMGEQSAAGLSSASGVVMLSVPEYTNPGRGGLQTGDVIVSFKSMEIKDFEQLQDIIKKNSDTKKLTFGVIRNQEKIEVTIEL